MKSLLDLFRRRREAGTTDAVPPPDELLSQGSALEDSGDFEAARALYQKVVLAAPRLAAGHRNLGNAQAALGRTSEAIASYRRAVELQPADLASLLNLGAVLLARQSVSEAEESYRRALALKPDSADAWAGLGCALEMGSEFEEAQSAYRQALEHDPAHEGSASRLAQCLRASGQARAAVEVLQSLLQRKPGSITVLRALAEINGGIGEYEAAIESYRRILDIAPFDLDAHSNLLWTLNFLPDITVQQILSEHRRFAELLESSTTRISLPPASAHRRLRIGYLSPDFRRHSVSCFIEPVLQNHDRNSFEAHCFYTLDAWDDVSDRLRQRADRWHDVAGLSDEEIAARIVDNEIDILVDLAGHSAHNRVRLLALKPAPLQFTWLGYLCTTGLTAVDYRLCDARTDPEGIAEAWQVERPARLPDTQWCYQPQVALPGPSRLPFETNGYWTFGSFNQESKLNDVVLDAWGAVLAALPRSRLRIVGVSCDVVDQRIRACFSRLGIAMDRVDLLGRIPIEQYFEAYASVDIALDSFPYNGATTTCDALLMGVPVATTKGERAISRGGVSLLTVMGLSDWIADSPAALVDLLKVQTNDPGRMATLRAELPARIQASAIMDGKRFTRNLEQIFAQAWKARTSA